MCDENALALAQEQLNRAEIRVRELEGGIIRIRDTEREFLNPDVMRMQDELGELLYEGGTVMETPLLADIPMDTQTLAEDPQINEGMRALRAANRRVQAGMIHAVEVADEANPTLGPAPRTGIAGAVLHEAREWPMRYTGGFEVPPERREGETFREWQERTDNGARQ